MPPLGQLIYERRDRYIQAQMLETEATDWERSERKDDLLARRGGRLAFAQELLADDEFGPGMANSASPVPAYVGACAEVDAIEREREDRLRQAELKAAKEREAAAEETARAAQEVALAARRTSRRTAIGLIASIILAVIAGGFGWYALEQQKTATAERDTALTTQSQFLSDLSRQHLVGARSDPGTAMLLALEGLPDEAVGPDGQQLSNRSHEPEPELALNQALAARLERSVISGHTSAVQSVAFSPDGSRLLTGSWDNTARLWDAATGKELRCLEGHGGAVESVAFSPDGSRLLIGSWDKTARLGDAGTGKELRRLEGHTGGVTSVAFSPDGSRLLTGSWDNTARLWDAATGQELRRLEGHGGAVESVAFSPDGSRLLTSSSDSTARLWDAATSQELRRLEGHTSYVNSVAFSPDGSRLLTGSDDNTARLWAAPLRLPKLVDEAKKIAPRCLTQQQRKDFFLQPEPPRWCITGAGLEAGAQPSKWKPLWPYRTEAWRDWLAAKDRGEKLPLPTE